MGKQIHIIPCSAIKEYKNGATISPLARKYHVAYVTMKNYLKRHDAIGKYKVVKSKELIKKMKQNTNWNIVHMAKKELRLREMERRNNNG